MSVKEDKELNSKVTHVLATKLNKLVVDREQSGGLNLSQMGVELDGPYSMTYKRRQPKKGQSEYTRKSLLGGEEFFLTGFRAGKTGALILILKSSRQEDSDCRFAEMKHLEATTHLKGLDILLDALTDESASDFDSYIASHLANSANKLRVDHERQQQKEAEIKAQQEAAEEKRLEQKRREAAAKEKNYKDWGAFG